MSRLEYLRPYEYQEELRLFGVIRNADHALFIGYGFKENAKAYVERNSTITELKTQSINHAEYDVLTTTPFSSDYPFRVYVVNPDNEAGQTSNAVEFGASDQIPVLDVIVDGKSAVSNQIAVIDLTGKLDQIRQPDKIYGTDKDGKEVVFDRKQIEGVQHFILNGSEVKLVDGTISIDDIAKISKTVPRVTNPDILYGTDVNGNQVTYSRNDFATTNQMGSANNAIANKQDKDKTATDGTIAVMKSHQSVGSNVKLTDVTTNIDNLHSDVNNLEVKHNQDVNDIRSQLADGLIKDWKATSGSHAIENHPVSSTNSSIVITPLTKEEEGAYRGTPNAIVIGVPVNTGNASVAVGQSVTTGASSVAVGSNTKASGSNSSAVGASAQATGSSSAVFGYAASASQSNAIAIGPNAIASASNSVAIGYNSVATEENTVSVGLPAAGDQPASLKRIVNVADPTTYQDAATKAYVDAKINKIMNAVNDIISKIYGKPTIGSDGHVNWGSASNLKIPMADLNIFSTSNPDNNTVADSIRSRDLADDDIKVQ